MPNVTAPPAESGASEYAGRTVVDYSSTFDESDVTVSTTKTQVQSDGEVVLDPDVVGTQTSRPNDNNSQAYGGEGGIVFNPNVDFVGLKSVPSSNNGGGGVSSIKVTRDSDGAELASYTGDVSNGSTFSLDVSLSAGTDYRLTARPIGTGKGFYDAPSFPYTSSDVDIVAGVSGGSRTTSSVDVFKSITAIIDPGYTSGSVTVEWPEPDHVSTWDKVFADFIEDGETVTVDILDENDTVISTGVQSEANIRGVATDQNIKMKANISRNDLANNPRLTFAQRRWLR